MKKIINGLRYDSDKAIAIGSSHAVGYSRSDFGYWEATLYKTPRAGRFFIAGKGGPMTRFAQRCGNNGRTGGSDLIPMTADEARAWAEEHLDADEIEAAFSEHIADA